MASTSTFNSNTDPNSNKHWGRNRAVFSKYRISRCGIVLNKRFCGYKHQYSYLSWPLTSFDLCQICNDLFGEFKLLNNYSLKCLTLVTDPECRMRCLPELHPLPSFIAPQRPLLVASVLHELEKLLVGDQILTCLKSWHPKWCRITHYCTEWRDVSQIFGCDVCVLSYLVVHSPYSLSQPYEGKSYGFPIVTSDAATRIKVFFPAPAPKIHTFVFLRLEAPFSRVTEKTNDKFS